MMEHVRIETVDGVSLGATVYGPRSEARAVVVIQAGTAIPQTHYRAFAEHLAAQGCVAITYDYRGIGESRPASLVSYDASMLDWALRDARAVLAWAERGFPGSPRFVVGHSFGGQTIGLLDELGEVDGVVLVAAQLGFYGHWPLPERLTMALMWHVAVPVATKAAGYYPGALGLGGVDLPAGVAREWARWCTSPGYLTDHDRAAHERFARFDRPTLMFSFTDDHYAPRPAVEAFVRELRSAPLTHERIDPRAEGLPRIGHFGFFRDRSRHLWPRVDRFIDAVRQGTFRARDARAPTLDDVLDDLRYGAS